MKENGPQLEKGHTRIANELFEAIIQYPFNNTERKIVLFVIRKTYGWGRKKAFISYTQIRDATKSDMRNIKKYVKKLIKDKVITKQIYQGKNILSLNKHYSLWSMWIT